MPAVAVSVLQRTPNAAFAAEEFFKASISNEHTRRAYGRIAGRFLAWCAERGLELRAITPGLAGEYIGELAGSAPSKNQALAALRHFFDALMRRHAVALNPFASVRGVKYSITEGKTAELGIEQARKLFKSIDAGHIIGRRDHAVLGVLAYTGARIGAVAKLALSDYRNLGEHRVLRFKEKGGKEREIPVPRPSRMAQRVSPGGRHGERLQKQGSSVPRRRWQAQAADCFVLPPSFHANR
jgi:integrase/recombinase XerD